MGPQTERGAPRTPDPARTDRRPIVPKLLLSVVSNVHPAPRHLAGGPARATHRALVRLLARVSTHVHHQHVLRLEGLLLARAGLPAAHELLLLPVDVLVVNVLPGTSPRRGMSPATHPSGPHLVCADHPPDRPAPTCRPRLLVS